MLAYLFTRTVIFMHIAWTRAWPESFQDEISLVWAWKSNKRERTDKKSKQRLYSKQIIIKGQENSRTASFTMIYINLLFTTVFINLTEATFTHMMKMVKSYQNESDFLGELVRSFNNLDDFYLNSYSRYGCWCYLGLEYNIQGKPHRGVSVLESSVWHF